MYTARIQSGEQGVLTPLKNHNNMGLLSNNGPDPLKVTKLPSQHLMLGHHQHASESLFKMAFRWRSDDGVVFRSHQLKRTLSKLLGPL